MFLMEYDEARQMRLFWMEGWQEGYKEGFKEGFKEDFEQGLHESAEVFATIVPRLFAQGRIDDIARAANDRDYANMLLEELRTEG